MESYPPPQPKCQGHQCANTTQKTDPAFPDRSVEENTVVVYTFLLFGIKIVMISKPLRKIKHWLSVLPVAVGSNTARYEHGRAHPLVGRHRCRLYLTLQTLSRAKTQE